MKKNFQVKTATNNGDGSASLTVTGTDIDLLVEGAEMSIDVKVEGVEEEDLAAELESAKIKISGLESEASTLHSTISDLQSKLDAANEELNALKTPAEEKTDATKTAENGGEQTNENGGGEAGQ